MDILYEESAVNSNAQKAEKRYRIINIFSKFFGVLAIIFAVILFFNLLTFLFSFKGMTAENRGSAIALLVLLLFLTTLFGGPWLACYLLKRRTNLSYDYTFVSGELRISKVFNVNRRKFLYKIQPESILKLGDADSRHSRASAPIPRANRWYARRTQSLRKANSSCISRRANRSASACTFSNAGKSCS